MYICLRQWGTWSGDNQGCLEANFIQDSPRYRKYHTVLCGTSAILLAVDKFWGTQHSLGVVNYGGMGCKTPTDSHWPLFPSSFKQKLNSYMFKIQVVWRRQQLPSHPFCTHPPTSIICTLRTWKGRRLCWLTAELTKLWFSLHVPQLITFHVQGSITWCLLPPKLQRRGIVFLVNWLLWSVYDGLLWSVKNGLLWYMGHTSNWQFHTE